MMPKILEQLNAEIIKEVTPSIHWQEWQDELMNITRRFNALLEEIMVEQDPLLASLCNIAHIQTL